MSIVEEKKTYELKIYFGAWDNDEAARIADKMVYDRICYEWNPVRHLSLFGLWRVWNWLGNVPFVGVVFRHNFGVPCWWDLGVGPVEIPNEEIEDAHSED